MPAVPHPTIALLQSSSLTSVVQQEIERRILQGELAPGAKLIEATLAEMLGVSRGPVREAFRMLEEAGLVRQEKNRGVFVRSIPLDEAIEIFDLRAAMDEVVGRCLAQSITPEQLREVRAMVEAMEKAVKAGAADAYHLLNLEFHDKLVELCRQPQADSDLPPPDQRVVAVPTHQSARRQAAADLGRRAPGHRQGDRQR